MFYKAYKSNFLGLNRPAYRAILSALLVKEKV